MTYRYVIILYFISIFMNGFEHVRCMCLASSRYTGRANKSDTLAPSTTHRRMVPTSSAGDPSTGVTNTHGSTSGASHWVRPRYVPSSSEYPSIKTSNSIPTRDRANASPKSWIHGDTQTTNVRTSIVSSSRTYEVRV